MDDLPPLRDLRRQAISLLLDFDGTLVEIAPRPEAILPAPGLEKNLRRLLETLEGKFAIVSGRALANIRHYVGEGIPVVGSHGAEFSKEIALELDLEHDAEAIHRRLRDIGGHYSSTLVELKPYGGAVHFRANPDAGEPLLRELTQLASEHGLRLQEGKMVIEVLPVTASKGRAVEALMRLEPYRGTKPIFVGDDLTDEEAFRVARELGGFGVIVGEERQTHASYRLANVSKVHEWMGF